MQVIHQAILSWIPFIILTLIYAVTNRFSDLKFSGNKEWLDASIAPFHGCMIDDGIGNNNLNLLVAPQYGRNPDESG